MLISSKISPQDDDSEIHRGISVVRDWVVQGWTIQRLGSFSDWVVSGPDNSQPDSGIARGELQST